MYWTIGLDFSFMNWIIGVIICYFGILLYGRVLYKSYMSEHKDGPLPNFKRYTKVITQIAAFLIVCILAYFLITKDKVYTYEVEDIKTVDITELMDKVNKEFKPDNGLLYYDDKHSQTLGVTISNDLNVESINLELYHIKNNNVYVISIYNRNNTIIMHEHLALLSELKIFRDSLHPLNMGTVIEAYHKIDINQIITLFNTPNTNENPIQVNYEPIFIFIISSHYEYDYNNLVKIDKMGNLTTITLNDLPNITYTYFTIYINGSIIHCFVER